jgi:DNA invertase Pin-like site-specific DNA recombinase
VCKFHPASIHSQPGNLFDFSSFNYCCVFRVFQNLSKFKFKDKRSKIKDQRSKIKDQRSKTKDQRQKIKDKRSKTKDQRQKTKDKFKKNSFLGFIQDKYSDANETIYLMMCLCLFFLQAEAG